MANPRESILGARRLYGMKNLTSDENNCGQSLPGEAMRSEVRENRTSGREDLEKVKQITDLPIYTGGGGVGRVGLKTRPGAEGLRGGGGGGQVRKEINEQQDSPGAKPCVR
ncbi:hypothetical protein J6590_034679 [Homalodisca vitripennis]|nr:hypothetical protein J6590_034679 [Homalodisca vitripennis]